MAQAMLHIGHRDTLVKWFALVREKPWLEKWLLDRVTEQEFQQTKHKLTNNQTNKQTDRRAIKQKTATQAHIEV